jgi:hypothetical protein
MEVSMKTKFFFFLALLAGFFLLSSQAFSQEKKQAQPVVQLDAQKIAVEHNNLIKEFWGKNLKSKNAQFPFSKNFLYDNIVGFLKEKGIKIPFGKSDAIMISEDPIKGVREKVKEGELKSFLITSLNQLNGISDTQIPDVLKKIKKNSENLKERQDIIIANIFIAVAEKSYDLYTSKDWENILQEYYNYYNSNNQVKMMSIWKVATMVLADAAGAAIGALAGANPATIVGGATGVSALATKLLQETK